MEQEYNPRRLSQLRHLRRETAMLSQRVRQMERAERMGNSCIAGMPGEGARERVAGAGGEIAAMRALLNRRRLECLRELAALYRYIDGVADSVVRQILTLRYVDGKTWHEVARGIGESDEQYPRRIHDAFFLDCRRRGERRRVILKSRKEKDGNGEQHEGYHGEAEAVCGLLH